MSSGMKRLGCLGVAAISALGIALSPVAIGSDLAAETEEPRSTTPLTVAAGLGMDLSVDETLVWRQDVRHPGSDWEVIDLAGLVPAGTILIYVEVDARYEHAEPGEAVSWEIRQAGVADTHRHVDLQGQLFDEKTFGSLYAWLPVNPLDPRMEYRAFEIDSVDGLASAYIKLRGYIVRG